MRSPIRYGLLAFALILLVLALLPMVLFNKDDVRQKLARMVYDATGREFTVAGNLSLSLIPSPRFTLEDVRLANWKNSSEPWMVKIRKVTVTAAPMDLLHGKVTASSIDLDAPEILLERRAGRGNWQFLRPGQLPPRAENGNTQIPSTFDVSAALSQLPQTASLIDPSGLQMAFDRMNIKDGSVRYLDAGKKTTLAVNAIKLGIDAQSLLGPYEAKGQATVNGHKVDIAGALDEVSTDRAVPMRLDVEALGSKIHAEAMVLRNTGVGAVVKGSMDVAITDFAKALSGLGAANVPVFSGLPLQWNGDFRVSAVDGDIQDSVLRFGGDEAKANISWNLKNKRPEIAVDIIAKRIQADAWVSAQTALLENAHSIQDVLVSTAYAAQSADGLHLPSVHIPNLPQGVDAQLTAKVDTVVWRGQAIHDAIVDAELSHGDLVIHKASADLPGAANVQAFGLIGTAQKAPTLDVTVQAKAANLRGVLTWLGMDVSGIPADRFRRGEISTAISLKNGGLLQLRDTAIVLDSSQAKGAADIRLGGRLGFGLSLAVDQVNWDAYQMPAAQQSAHVTAEPRLIFASTQTPAPVSPFAKFAADLEKFDANVNVTIGRLTVAKQLMEKVKAQGSLQYGDLTIAKLSSVVGHTGKMSVTGQIHTQDQLVPELKNIKIDITSGRADTFLQVLPISLPRFVSDWRRIKATITASGALTNVATNSVVTVGKTTIRGVGGFNLLTGMPAANANITVTAPTLSLLADTFGAKVSPALGRKGAVKISLPVQRQSTGYASPNLRLEAGDIVVTGDVLVKTTGPRPYATVKLKGNTLPIFAAVKGESEESVAQGPHDILLPIPASYVAVSTQSQKPYPWEVLRTFDGDVTAQFDVVETPTVQAKHVNLHAVLNQGIADIHQATAEVLGGTVDFKGRADVRKTPEVTGALTVKDVTLAPNSPLFKGKKVPVSGVVSLVVDGQSRGVNQDALLAALTGKGHLNVVKGTFVGANLDAMNTRLKSIKSLQDLLDAVGAASQGQTAFDSLAGDFTIAKGVLTSDAIQMKAPSGKGAVSGRVGLVDRTMDVNAQYALASLLDAPAFGVRVHGGWENPRVFFDLQKFQTYVLQRGLGQFLNGLTGKSNQTKATTTTPKDAANQEPPAPAPQKKLKVKDVLRGFLNAIPQN